MISTTHGGRRGDQPDPQPAGETARIRYARRAPGSHPPRSQRYRIGCEHRIRGGPPPPAPPAADAAARSTCSPRSCSASCRSRPLWVPGRRRPGRGRPTTSASPRPTPATRTSRAASTGRATTVSTPRRVLQARKYALLEDEATASGDFVAAAYTNVMINNYLGRSCQREPRRRLRRRGGRRASRPTSARPPTRATSPSCAATPTRTRSSRRWPAASRTPCRARPSIFTQAALVDALALFLLGVAGINRLRSARFATLALGAAAYLASLVMMVTAY